MKVMNITLPPLRHQESVSRTRRITRNYRGNTEQAEHLTFLVIFPYAPPKTKSLVFKKMTKEIIQLQIPVNTNSVNDKKIKKQQKDIANSQ